MEIVVHLNLESSTWVLGNFALLLYMSYIVAKFPLSDEVLLHVKFVNFDNRQSCHFSDVECFMQRYETVLSLGSSENNEIFDEFVEYQLLL